MSSILTLAIVAVVLYRTWQIEQSTGTRVGGVLAVLIGVSPAIVSVTFHSTSPRLVFGFGVVLFAGSVLLKWALSLGILNPYVHSHIGTVPSATVQGTVSAACELGVAAVAFGTVLSGLDAWQVFGVGAGAAFCEALVVSSLGNVHTGTAQGEHVASQMAALDRGRPWTAIGVAALERGIATTDHIACRGLVALSVASGRVWPAALAFAAVATTDGLAYYALVRKWNFSEPGVAARLYGPLMFIAAGATLAWLAAASILEP